MKVKIEQRRDFELYVKKEVAKMKISNKQKANVRKVAMYCFDCGIAFMQNKLEVEVDG